MYNATVDLLGTGSVKSTPFCFSLSTSETVSIASILAIFCTVHTGETTPFLTNNSALFLETPRVNITSKTMTNHTKHTFACRDENI